MVLQTQICKYISHTLYIYKYLLSHLNAGIEISLSLEAQIDLLFVGWACRIFENFNGKGPDFKEMLPLCCNFVHCLNVTIKLYQCLFIIICLYDSHLVSAQ